MREQKAKVLLGVALWLLGGFTLAQAQTSTVAGTMAGQFSVNESGAATYRIPIQVPPGVAGMEPKLELSYSSQSGNGLLGVGWGLGGLSAIGRCPRTMAQDNARGSVNYDMNDRYCLDGQRLILVSGTYGTAGSEYRTELESFSRIIASGTAGNGVASFTVQSKAGLTMEYGNTADSRIEAQGKTSVRIWAINKISDVKTNFMTFSYVEDNANGDFYPNRIDYSGNTAAGQAANNSVQFSYETRPDIVRMYLGGSAVAAQKRLLNARTYIGATLAANYRVNYGPPSAATSRALVSSIDYCDGSGACFPAKSFAWSDGGQGLNNPVSATQTVAGNNLKDYYNAYPGDYNGDGVTDMFYVGTVDSIFCPGPTLTQANSLANCVSIPTGNWKDNFTIYPGDYNGDGITDLYLVGAGGSHFCTNPTFAPSITCIQTVVGNNLKDYHNAYPGDYNGDGITDLYYVGVVNSLFCPGPAVAEANSLNNCVQTVANNNWKDTFSIYPGDYNGDGITDLYLVGNAEPGSYFCSGVNLNTSNENMCVRTVVNNDWRGAFNIYPGDYNGDGVTDLYLVGSSGSHFVSGGNGRPDMLNAVTDGSTVALAIERTSIAGTAVYTKGSGSTYPVLDIQTPMSVVSTVSSSNGVGGTVTTQYSYGGLKAELGTGRGMLGFRWMKSKNLANNIESYTEFNQNWPFTGSVAKSETRLAGSGNAGVLKRTTNSYTQGTGSATGTTFVYPSQSVEESWDLGGTPYPTVTNSYQYGQSPQFGDPTQITVGNSSGASKSTANEYWPANTGSGNWVLGRLKKASVTSVTP